MGRACLKTGFSTASLEYNKRLEQKSDELAQIGEELRGANVRLRELDKLKDEFVAMVSHELRTPLTSIRAFAEILRDSPEVTPEQKSHFLDVIVKESERLSRLIEEILDLARLESGRMRLDLKPINLNELAKDSADAITQLYDDRQVDLELILPEEQAWVTADPDKLQQVIINLLDNASKFTAPKDAKVVMTINTQANNWFLAVEDNGTGIAEEERDKVFENFHQIQQHKNTSGLRPKGSGLGLPISRGIINHHQGQLYIESGQVLKGARFVIVLPAIKPPTYS
ncbi:MAG TPA: HAMP domain-containing sensor histidine kinase [Marinospirillum sp.]|uniref:sensor histidine kinase n=1 Tax=Marinospirillum sp. TaxID=2183934 RepID=UPI002B497CD4|nr:HAMP domain-containing sensor histidine kinase [Marinospirillum sp.]HKM14461.1 HAMP domain-containing sensor histidine kinase [Marinospirillum sp.]